MSCTSLAGPRRWYCRSRLSYFVTPTSRARRSMRFPTGAGSVFRGLVRFYRTLGETRDFRYGRTRVCRGRIRPTVESATPKATPNPKTIATAASAALRDKSIWFHGSLLIRGKSLERSPEARQGASCLQPTIECGASHRQSPRGRKRPRRTVAEVLADLPAAPGRLALSSSSASTAVPAATPPPSTTAFPTRCAGRTRA